MDYLKIGYIRKPHGLKGELKVLPLTNDINRYKKLKSIYLHIDNTYSEFFIENTRIANDTVIIKLKDLNKIEDVEALRDVYIFIDKNDGVALEKNEYYSQDLIGCDIIYNNENYGNVKAMMDNGSCDIFVVNYKGKEILYPFINDYIKKIDIDSKKVIINQIEGFFD